MQIFRRIRHRYYRETTGIKRNGGALTSGIRYLHKRSWFNRGVSTDIFIDSLEDISGKQFGFQFRSRSEDDLWLARWIEIFQDSQEATESYFQVNSTNIHSLNFLLSTSSSRSSIFSISSHQFSHSRKLQFKCKNLRLGNWPWKGRS